MEKKIEIPPYAAKALKLLETSGYEAWCVGGCVRDAVMGRKPHDWDICTSALPEETLTVFSRFKTIPTGIKHGTITVLIDGKPIEITTYRCDGDYSDHRRPDSVTFVRDIKSDLERRDFTMNSMCVNLKGEIFDPFGGMNDISNKTIRCVGEAEKRFDEDALRIFRAVRFAAKTGFDIDSATEKAMLKMCGTLCQVSEERLFSELKNLLVQPYAGQSLIRYREVIAQVIPEVRACFDFDQRTPYHCYDVWEHIVRSVDLVPPKEILRLTMLLHDIGKPQMFTIDENGAGHFKGHPKLSEEMADKILRRLKSDNRTRETVCELIYEHDNRVPPERRAMRRFLARQKYIPHDKDFFDMWIEVRLADTLAQSEYQKTEKLQYIDDEAAMANQLFAEECCMKISDLEINGHDLIAMGLHGREIGDMLKKLFELVTDEKIPNEHQELLKTAERIIAYGE